jgi:predicted metal-binding protein
MYVADSPTTGGINQGGYQMTKIGIIRCQQTEDMCPGTADFKIASEGKMAFAEIGPVEVVGFVSCGGCPGKKAVSRAKLMVERGADAIAIASCISKGNPIDFPCPHYEEIKESIAKKMGPDTKIIEWTH